MENILSIGSKKKSCQWLIYCISVHCGMQALTSVLTEHQVRTPCRWELYFDEDEVFFLIKSQFDDLQYLLVSKNCMSQEVELLPQRHTQVFGIILITSVCLFIASCACFDRSWIDQKLKHFYEKLYSSLMTG